MSKTRVVSTRTKNCDAYIGKLHWKGAVYPVREIYIDDNAYRVSVKSLENDLSDDIRNGIYEAMEVNEEIDFYCMDEAVYVI